MDIVIEADFIDIRNGYKKLKVTLDNIDEDGLLSQLSIEDCIGHFGKDEFLDAIGAEAAIEHFELTLKEDN